jgi:dUTP pyrophosphatase
MSLQLKIHCQDNAVMPYRAHPQDAGLDITAISYQQRGEYLYFFDTALCIEPPEGYYVELIPRSSIVWKGWIMPNSIGVIDPNYRGTLQIPLRWLGKVSEENSKEASTETAKEAADHLLGQRIAQMVVRPLILCDLVTVSANELSSTDRGKGAFGSSGTKHIE